MKLKKLIKDIEGLETKGVKDVEVTGVCSNSKSIAPGNIFVAKRGMKQDGAHFIPEAISGGAVAVLTDLYNPMLTQAIQLIHPDINRVEAQIAAEYHGHPSQKMLVVGITGTNGKTTTSYLIRYLLEKQGCQTGLIGTIEYIVGKQHHQPTHTTPDVSTNHKLLKEMLVQGCQAGVMEVTSHALKQGRVDCIDFDIAIFTNLTEEHLDYHVSMEEYCQAKSLLFSNLKETGVAIVNKDDPWHRKIIAQCKAPIFTYGIDSEADLMAKNLNITKEGTEFTLFYRGQEVTLFTPLVGRFNVYNTLAALAVGLSRGQTIKQLKGWLKNFSSVAGRLEPVDNVLGKKVFVDFAHTEDALKNVLQTLKETGCQKIITVFGCGGDRDRSKRPRMAHVAESFSNYCIVTNDNPRTEDPVKICEEIASGFKGAHFTIILDRYDAIHKGIELAGEEDVVLIAGKGHERYQVFARHTIDFDDVEAVQEICNLLKRSSEKE